MARVKSYLRLRGSMGETTFVKQRNNSGGYRSQDKLETTPGRFKTDPNMARVRENSHDFTTAARGGKLIRKSISILVNNAKDRTLTSRMLKTLMAIVKSDLTSPAGKGNIVDGDTTMLRDFAFNANADISSLVRVLISKSMNRVTGQLTIDIPVFIPKQALKFPSAATHFQFVAAGAEIDFGAGTYKANIQQSIDLPINNVATAPVTLTCTATPNSTEPLFLFFGIRFFTQKNTEMLSVMNAESKALVILDVNKV